jgi:hypothetical protein
VLHLVELVRRPGSLPAAPASALSDGLH